MSDQQAKRTESAGEHPAHPSGSSDDPPPKYSLFKLREHVSAPGTWHSSYDEKLVVLCYANRDEHAGPRGPFSERVPARLLFKLAPALQKYLEGDRIFVPCPPLNDDVASEIASRIVACAKEDKPFDMTPANTIENLINVHCFLVFCEMWKEADALLDHLWNVFETTALTLADIQWLWDLYTGYVGESYEYTPPFATQYVQMMCWQLVNLEVKGTVGADVVEYAIIQNHNLKQLIMERHSKYGTHKGYEAQKHLAVVSEVSKETCAELLKHFCKQIEGDIVYLSFGVKAETEEALPTDQNASQSKVDLQSPMRAEAAVSKAGNLPSEVSKKKAEHSDHTQTAPPKSNPFAKLPSSQDRGAAPAAAGKSASSRAPISFLKSTDASSAQAQPPPTPFGKPDPPRSLFGGLGGQNIGKSIFGSLSKAAAAPKTTVMLHSSSAGGMQDTASSSASIFGTPKTGGANVGFQFGAPKPQQTNAFSGSLSQSRFASTPQNENKSMFGSATPQQSPFGATGQKQNLFSPGASTPPQNQPVSAAGSAQQSPIGVSPIASNQSPFGQPPCGIPFAPNAHRASQAQNPFTPSGMNFNNPAFQTPGSSPSFNPAGPSTSFSASGGAGFGSGNVNAPASESSAGTLARRTAQRAAAVANRPKIAARGTKGRR